MTTAPPDYSAECSKRETQLFGDLRNAAGTAWSPRRRSADLHQMPPNLADLLRLGDHGKNSHWGRTPGTDQPRVPARVRVDPVHLGDQLGPRRAAFLQAVPPDELTALRRDMLCELQEEAHQRKACGPSLEELVAGGEGDRGGFAVHPGRSCPGTPRCAFTQKDHLAVGWKRRARIRAITQPAVDRLRKPLRRSPKAEAYPGRGA